jgi:hypothetical protein
MLTADQKRILRVFARRVDAARAELSEAQRNLAMAASLALGGRTDVVIDFDTWDIQEKAQDETH